MRPFPAFQAGILRVRRTLPHLWTLHAHLLILLTTHPPTLSASSFQFFPSQLPGSDPPAHAAPAPRPAGRPAGRRRAVPWRPPGERRLGSGSSLSAGRTTPTPTERARREDRISWANAKGQGRREGKRSIWRGRGGRCFFVRTSGRVECRGNSPPRSSAAMGHR